MILFYTISLCLYSFLLRIVAPFNSKAKQWLDGRKNIFASIKKSLKGNEEIAWFHVSSLGEFEQGRPVIEAFREKYPHYKIFLTFFSPSGYEIRKNYDGADYVFYLPLDSKENAKKFLDLVQPKIAFFVKYEFWYHYLFALHQRKTPTYIFSAIFRDKQLFFKWYGSWYRNMLRFFTKLYVQNDYSKSLLSNVGIVNTEIVGDTRFDRVYDLAKNAKQIPLIEKFAANNVVVIAGSTWEKDEELIAAYAQQGTDKVKWIIAPHEVHKSHIDKIIALFKTPILKYSDATFENIHTTNILIVDSIGILSSLYRYGSTAYIGGGFGNGIHNTLEAATYGLPVVFGPNYKRFKEACDLLEIGSGFSIKNFNEFKSIFDTLLSDEDFMKKTGEKSSDYVNKMRGGTQIILSQIKL